MGRIMRRPRTIQEKRANQGWPVRGKRSPSRLIDPWDDYIRKDLYNRNWKRHRRTQYKVKGVVNEHHDELQESRAS